MVDIETIKRGTSTAQKGKLKEPKFKLTKEQKLYVDNLVRLENRIAVCREFIGLWMNFFKFLAEDISNKEIKPEEEKAFFQAMTLIARKHFLFVELMNDCFDRANDLINVISMANSLAAVQTMPENTRSKMELDWHTLLLEMNKALARLLRRLPGNPTLSEALKIADDMLKNGGQIQQNGKGWFGRKKG